MNDLHAHIQEAERIIANQNENLSALRHLLRKETVEPTPNGLKPVTVTSASVTSATAQEPRTHPGVDFKGKTSDIILALVQRSGEGGKRPRDIAAILLERKLITKGSNTVYSYLSEFKKKGLVKLKAEGLYVGSSKPTAAKPVAVASMPAKKALKKRTMSAAGREAVRRAQKARWAAVKKAKG
jgi:hypothetical protein